MDADGHESINVVPTLKEMDDRYSIIIGKLNEIIEVVNKVCKK